MNGCAVKPKISFVAKNELNRTPASNENRIISKFINSHDFSFGIDEKTGELKTTVTNKKR